MKVETVRIKEISKTVTKGTTPTTLGNSFTQTGIPFLRAQNIIMGKIDLNEDLLFIDIATNEKLKRSKIYKNDILITIAGTIGRTAVVPDGMPEMNCNQAVAIIRPNNRVFSPYLKYWITSNEAIVQITGAKVTATISNLSLTQIKNLKIPLPPLPTQRRIAAILDKADALRRKGRELLDQYDELVQAVFLEMFGNPVKNPKNIETRKLDEFIIHLTSGGRGWSKYYSDSGARFIRSYDVQMNEISEEDIVHVSPPNNREA